MSNSPPARTEYASAQLRLRLVAPPADLSPYISAYYRTEVPEGVTVEDWLPPEEANLRTGEAIEYVAAIGADPVRDVPPSIISGPTDRVTYLRISGGKFWGIGLTPAGWARFIRAPAHKCANRFGDIHGSKAPEPLHALLEQLRVDGDEIEAATDLINQTFRDLMGDRQDFESTIHAVHLAMLSPDNTSVAALATMAGMNERTFARFCQRHLGFAPGVLLRRQRFLRSLGQYMLDPSMTWINSLDSLYWDQAHFIRDFRATMGMTPGDYAKRPHPVSTAAVHVTNARAGVAMQALYHPHQVAESQTGL